MINRRWIVVRELHWKPTAVGNWHVALDYVSTGTVLKLETSGVWSYPGSPSPADADGFPRGTVPDIDVPLKNAPVAAVVGRFGGSTAFIEAQASSPPTSLSMGPQTGVPFAIGRFCVIPSEDGPLFLAVNLVANRLAGVQEMLLTTIAEAKV